MRPGRSPGTGDAVDYDVTSAVTGGTFTGFLAAVGYTVKLGLDWKRQRHAEPREDARARVGDAATANAVLVQTLGELRRENERLVKRVASLEAENEEKDRKLDDLEESLRAVTVEVSRLTDELATLRTH